MKLVPKSLTVITFVSLTLSIPFIANAYVQKNLYNASSSIIIATSIPNEMGQPNPGPRNTNPIESRLMAMTTNKQLQRELDSVRANYQKWKGDQIAMKTQTRLAQIIHLRANQVGVSLK